MNVESALRLALRITEANPRPYESGQWFVVEVGQHGFDVKGYRAGYHVRIRQNVYIAGSRMGTAEYDIYSWGEYETLAREQNCEPPRVSAPQEGGEG